MQRVSDIYFWAKDATGAWVPALLSEEQDDTYVCVSNEGETHHVKKSEARTVHMPSLSGRDDLTEMEELTEEAIIYNLAQRYSSDQIYTYISDILVAINPYKVLPLYSPTIMNDYISKSENHEKCLPHVYGLADSAFRSMVMNDRNQAVVVSGESGAGKTESTKLVLQYLAELSVQNERGADDEIENLEIEQQIMQSTPLLEAFGNAKTVNNNNSSRFGRFVQIWFNKDCRIFGASMQNYLLEKARVVTQAEGERNYHIFYELCAGASEAERAELGLADAEEFKILNSGGCVTVQGVDDAEQFRRVLAAMAVLKISPADTAALLRVVAGLLHLGNVEFDSDGSEGSSGASCLAEVSKETWAKCCSLLQSDSASLLHGLLTRKMKIANEVIEKKNTPEEAAASRSALLKAVYDKTFTWLFAKINSAVWGEGELFHFVGVLDVYGFEIFANNYFEQLMINFANEKLQFHFNAHCFQRAQNMYAFDGVEIQLFNFADNSGCLALFEAPKTGLLALIDEELRLPVKSDDNLLERMHQMHCKHPNYEKPKANHPRFKIKHYAGDVTYQIRGFLDKNTDKLNADVAGFLASSQCPLVQSLFAKKAPPPPATAEEAADSTSSFSSTGTKPSASSTTELLKEIRDQENARERLSSQPLLKAKLRVKEEDMSIGKSFHQQLNALTDLLTSTEPHFVRCIKPNGSKAPDMFDNPSVASQIACLGLKDLVAIRQIGFPIWTPVPAFLERYKVLLPKVPSADDGKDSDCAGDDKYSGFPSDGGDGDRRALRVLLDALGVKPGDWSVGKTKVFMRYSVREALEAQRGRKISLALAKFQARVRGKLAMVRVRKIQKLRSEIEQTVQGATAAAASSSTAAQMEELERAIRQASLLGAAFAQLGAASTMLDRHKNIQRAVATLDKLTSMASPYIPMLREATLLSKRELGLAADSCPALRKAEQVLSAAAAAEDGSTDRDGSGGDALSAQKLKEVVEIAVFSESASLLTMAESLEKQAEEEAGSVDALALPSSNPDMLRSSSYALAQMRSSQMLKEQEEAAHSASKHAHFRKVSMSAGGGAATSSPPSPSPSLPAPPSSHDEYRQFADNRYKFHLFQGLRSPDDFCKGRFLQNKAQKQGMLLFTKKQLGKSLTKLPARLAKAALALFKSIQGFMGDRTYSFADSLPATVIGQAAEEVLLRDEVFCQLYKQLSQHSEPANELKGWVLLSLCCERFAPSQEAVPFVFHFLLHCQGLTEARAPTTVAVKEYAAYCYHVLAATIARLKKEPDQKLHNVTVAKVVRMQKRSMTPAQVRVNMCDGSFWIAPVNPWECCKQSVEALTTALQLEDTGGLSVYEVKGNHEFFVPPSRCLLDFHAGAHLAAPDLTIPFFVCKQRLRRKNSIPGESSCPATATLLYYQYMQELVARKHVFADSDLIKVLAMHYKHMGRVSGNTPSLAPSLPFSATASGRVPKSLALAALTVDSKIAKAAEELSRNLPEVKDGIEVLKKARELNPLFGEQRYKVQMDLGRKKTKIELCADTEDVKLLVYKTNDEMGSYPLSNISNVRSTKDMAILTTTTPAGKLAQTREHRLLTADGAAIRHLLYDLINKPTMPNDLHGIMQWQQHEFPGLRVPVVLKVLSERIQELGGFTTTGIFRISIPSEQLQAMLEQISKGELQLSTSNPHAPACLLKKWLRELDTPVIGHHLYNACVAVGQNMDSTPTDTKLVFDQLPAVNRAVISHITEQLVVPILAEEKTNRMTTHNLGVVFAPGLLRCTASDPVVVMANSKHEVTFVDLMFQWLTSCLQGPRSRVIEEGEEEDGE